jgi:histidinol-phosphate phosphatase family protein
MTTPLEKAIFVDRDGVINKDPGGWTRYDYVTKWDEFHFLPGVFEALRRLKEHGYKVIVISNQAGVGKGYFREEELREIDRRMVDEVRRRGADIEASYYCVHAEADGCACRKPKTGLFDRAMEAYAIDLKKACFIGDTRRDIIAGHNAGLETALVLTGKTSPKDVDAWDVRPDYMGRDLRDAVEWVLTREPRSPRA